MNPYLYVVPIVVFVVVFILVIPKINKDRKNIIQATEFLKNKDVLLLSEISGLHSINDLAYDLIPSFDGSQIGSLKSVEGGGHGIVFGLDEGSIKLVSKPSLSRETPLTKEMVLYYSNEDQVLFFQGVAGRNYRICLLDKNEITKVNVVSQLEIVFKGWLSKDTINLCIVEDDNSRLYGDLFALLRQQ